MMIIKAMFLFVLTFHAMGKQHDQAGLPDPLGLTAGDELVDDALGRVGEVSKLRLPQNQRVRVGHTEAQFEAKNSVLGERGVAHSVGRLITANQSFD
mgnify:CR=1 FL=1